MDLADAVKRSRYFSNGPLVWLVGCIFAFLQLGLSELAFQIAFFVIIVLLHRFVARTCWISYQPDNIMKIAYRLPLFSSYLN